MRKGSRRKKPNWLDWLRYYFGRFLEVIGLVIVAWAMFFFFGGPEMRAMLTLTGAGALLFCIGWLLARKNPEAK